MPASTKLLLSIAVLVFLPPNSYGQLIEEWESNDGKKTKAAFGHLDEQAKTVTLLIPYEVPFDRLSARSLRLAELRSKTITDTRKAVASAYVSDRLERLANGDKSVLNGDRVKLTDPDSGTYKYVDDDVYGEVFGFLTLAHLRAYTNGGAIPEPTTGQREQWGIVGIRAKTKVKVISKHTIQNDIPIYYVEVVETALSGRKLYVRFLDLFDTRNP